jgi:DNA-directed RNA polymerase specialized sigma24 family protein
MTLEREGPGSFESFFRQHYGPIVRALVIVSGSETEAEDLAQEAFARALEHWNRVGAMESPVGYVYRTAFKRAPQSHQAHGSRSPSQVGTAIHRQ